MASGQTSTNPEQNIEKLRDSLQGCVSACLKIPELAQRDVVKDLSNLSKGLASREKEIETTDKALYDLPKNLAMYEELLVRIDKKASAITRAIARVEETTATSPLLLLRESVAQGPPLPTSHVAQC